MLGASNPSSPNSDTAYCPMLAGPHDPSLAGATLKWRNDEVLELIDSKDVQRHNGPTVLDIPTLLFDIPAQGTQAINTDSMTFLPLVERHSKPTAPMHSVPRSAQC